MTRLARAGPSAPRSLLVGAILLGCGGGPSEPSYTMRLSPSTLDLHRGEIVPWPMATCYNASTGAEAVCGDLSATSLDPAIAEATMLHRQGSPDAFVIVAYTVGTARIRFTAVYAPAGAVMTLKVAP